MLWDPSKVPDPCSYGNKLPTGAHPSTAFYLLHTAVDNGAMSKFGSGWNGAMKVRMLLFSVGYGAMNSQSTRPVLVETSANTLGALQREWGNLVQPLKKPTQMPPGTMNFIPAWAIRFQTAHSGTMWRGFYSLKGSHRMRALTNLRILRGRGHSIINGLH